MSSADVYSPEGAEYASGRGPMQFAQMAWRHKSLVVLGLVVGVVIGLLYNAQKLPQFHSSAQLMVIKKQSTSLPTGDPDPRASYYDDYLATHQVLIRSPLIVSRAVNKHHLVSLPSLRSDGDPSGTIRAALSVTRDKDTAGAGNSILNLDYRGRDPEDCAAVLIAVIDAYKDFLDEKYKNISDATLSKLLGQLDTLQRQLTSKQKEYFEFQQRSPLLYGKGTDGIAPQEDWVAQIQARRLTLMVRRAEIQGRMEAIEQALKEGRGRQVLLAQMLAAQRSANGSATATSPERRVDEQMFDLMMKEQLLLADYGADHPEVISVRRRMQLTREFFSKSQPPGGAMDLGDPVQWYVQSLKQELTDTDISIRALDRMTQGEQKEARDILKYKLEDRRFREDLARLQELYVPILRRLEEIKLVHDLGGFDAQVIAPPPPGHRIGTGFFQILFVASVGGLLMGLGLAYLAEYSDKSFRTPEEIRRRLGLPVVGHVPFLRPSEESLRLAAEGGLQLDPLLVSHFSPKSSTAEAFRGVRTSIYFSTKGEVHKVIQVTSPTKGDGKSTLTANLAVSIAQSGKRILLIDADLRKPRQHKIFGVSNAIGMGSVIADQAEWKDAVQPTCVQGLSLLPCGPLQPNPAELLTSTRLQEFIDTVREEYDFILIDTPPMLAVSDPSVVAPRVDGVLLAIRISKNGRPNAERAREILSTLGAKILGVVVNGAGRGVVGASGYSGASYGAYGYGYSYGYGYGGEGYYTEDKPNGEIQTPGATERENKDAEPRTGDPARRSSRRSTRAQSRRGLLESVWNWFKS